VDDAGEEAGLDLLAVQIATDEDNLRHGRGGARSR
jgi:hypothetical protein